MENKVEFYKWDKKGSLTFSVLNNGDFKEDYSVWDNSNKRFMRDGVLPDGTTVEDSKYIKKLDWNSKFSDNYRKSTQYIYNILLNDAEYKIGFNPSIHNKIQEMIKTINSTGGNIQGVDFTVTSNDKPGLERRYEVTVKKRDNTPIEVAGQNLTEVEQKVIQFSKEMGSVNESAFVTIATQQGISESRAKELFKTVF